MADEHPFQIRDRPERRYPPSGGVEYEGETVFVLTPDGDRSTGDLDALVQSVLDADRYVRGDFFDLPAPAYLVRDAEVGTSFRAVVRDGRVELHVLPHTEAVALAALFDELRSVGDGGWEVERRSRPAPGRD